MRRLTGVAGALGTGRRRRLLVCLGAGRAAHWVHPELERHVGLAPDVAERRRPGPVGDAADRATRLGSGGWGDAWELASTGLGSGGWRTGGRVGLRGVWVVQQARVRSRGNLVIFEIFSLLPSQNEYYSDCNAQLKGV